MEKKKRFQNIDPAAIAADLFSIDRMQIYAPQKTTTKDFSNTFFDCHVIAKRAKNSAPDFAAIPKEKELSKKHCLLSEEEDNGNILDVSDDDIRSRSPTPPPSKLTSARDSSPCKTTPSKALPGRTSHKSLASKTAPKSVGLSRTPPRHTVIPSPILDISDQSDDLDISLDQSDDDVVLLDDTSDLTPSHTSVLDASKHSVTSSMLNDSHQDEILIKIRSRSGLQRFRMVPAETFVNIFSEMAQHEGVLLDRLVFLHNDTTVDPYSTPQELGLTIADIIDCHVRTITDKISYQSAKANSISLWVQGVGSKKKMNIRVNEPFSNLMQQYAMVNQMDVKQLMFSFDGEVITGSSTPADLDLENDFTIDAQYKKK